MDMNSKQKSALKEILEGGAPDPTISISMPGDPEEYEVEQREDGFFEGRPASPKDGDKWIDSDGRLWEWKKPSPTAKGYKSSITHFEQFRVPMFCPECGSVMDKRLDEKFWYMRNKCFDCVVEEEHKMRVEGTYELYEKKKVLANMKSWVRDIEDGFEEFKAGMNTVNEVTETGEVLEWSELSEEQMDEMFSNAHSYIEHVKNRIKWLEHEIEELESSDKEQ
jgi:hypothetical protein